MGCVFCHEEFLMPVRAEILRDKSLVELQLTLAAAAASGTAKFFEPFPPHFLRAKEVRSRSGAFGDGYAGQGSEDNKDRAAVRAALLRMPRMAALADTDNETQLRDLLAARSRDGGSGGDSCPDAASSAYKLLQFVLGTNRLLLEQVTREEHCLPMLPSGATQLAVGRGHQVQNAPSLSRSASMAVALASMAALLTNGFLSCETACASCLTRVS